MRSPRWWILRLRKSIFPLLFFSLLCLLSFLLVSNFSHPEAKEHSPKPHGHKSYDVDGESPTRNESFKRDDSDGETSKNLGTHKLKLEETRNESLPRAQTKTSDSETIAKNKPSVIANPNVHVFYYGWYGTPEIDGQWWHWNHEYIPPWDKSDHRHYPQGAHSPPLDIGANFYPSLGPYSSRAPATITSHLAQISSSGAGVLAVSWYPPGQADEHGPPSDTIVPLLLQHAATHGLKVCLHVEPYQGRTAESLRSQLKYVHTTYGSHPAYYRVSRGSRSLPVFYIYDSYNLPPAQWARLFTSQGDLTVRGGELDGVFLGLLVDYKHRADISAAGLDGFYTYFASDGFSYGSSWRNWRSLASFARKAKLVFVPSVGPGYIDTRVRAWNGKNTRDRRGGKYYESAWSSALETRPRYVSVTSFNEWHEGTQIEAARPQQCQGFTYQDYGHKYGQNYYLDLTRKWTEVMTNKTRSPFTK